LEDDLLAVRGEVPLAGADEAVRDLADVAEVGGFELLPVLGGRAAQGQARQQGKQHQRLLRGGRLDCRRPHPQIIRERPAAIKGRPLTGPTPWNCWRSPRAGSRTSSPRGPGPSWRAAAGGACSACWRWWPCCCCGG